MKSLLDSSMFFKFQSVCPSYFAVSPVVLRSSSYVNTIKILNKYHKDTI